MPGTRRAAICITRSTIVSKFFASTDRSASAIRPGGGPPVLQTRISTPPSFCSAAAASRSALPAIGQVGVDPVGLAAARHDRVSGSLQLVFVAAGQQDMHTLFCQSLGDAEAEATRR